MKVLALGLTEAVKDFPGLSYGSSELKALHELFGGLSLLNQDVASSRLVVEFYRRLQDMDVSRASALQAAQLALLRDLRYDHPCYWAPFLLIHNCL